MEQAAETALFLARASGWRRGGGIYHSSQPARQPRAHVAAWRLRAAREADATKQAEPAPASGCGRPRPRVVDIDRALPCPALPCPKKRKKESRTGYGGLPLAGDRVGGRRAAARNTDRVSACVSSAPRLSDLAASGARLSRPRGWGALASYLAGRSCSCIDRLRVVLAHRVGRRAEIKSPAGGRYGHQSTKLCINA